MMGRGDGRRVMGERLDAYRRLAHEPNRFKDSGNLVFERFSALYPMAYEAGELSTKMKELVALALLIVRDCEDCITYHLLRLDEEGVTRGELFELFALTLVVGGSTTIPTLRRSAAFVDELAEDAATKGPADASSAGRDGPVETGSVP
jgi:AhpD family alkylhydroperoxidase